MAVIIDVDSHWEVEGDHPLKPWQDRLPPGRLAPVAHGVAGDLLRALPPADQPTPAELLPGLVALARDRGGPAALHPVHESTAEERRTWMDSVGIDHCLVNPGGYWQLLDFLGSDRSEGIRRCNDFLTEQLSTECARLHAVAVVDLADPEEAARELERARARGARAFFLSTQHGRPPGDRSPGHPDLDPVWAAATSLGMLAVIHVGNTSTDFTGWADIGLRDPRSGGVAALTRLANTQRTHAAQNLVAGMLYGGVFARHPALTVLLAELRVGWVPPFVEMLGRQAEPSFILGDWPWEMPGAEMLRRNLRITPLPGFGDDDALDVLRALPEVCVFSSDYPHHEGNVEPIEVYGPGLQSLDPTLRAQFMGDNIAECFARTGQPLGG